MKRIKKNKVYRLQSKFRKKPELLEKYGFIPYETIGEEDDEIIYAKGIVLSQESSIFKYLKRAMEKIYLNATTEERQADFKDFEFKEILTPEQKRDYNLILTDKIISDFTHCQLCFVNKGVGEYCLFINAPDRVEYYGVEVLNECIKDIIDLLLKNKVIYKAKV